MSISTLQQDLREFAAQRNWDRFHTPKNLAMALAGETGELLELFQWLTEQESQPENLTQATHKRVQEEVADVFLYLLRLADKLNIDLEEAAAQKLLRNAKKYPVELAKGNAVKYNRRDGSGSRILQPCGSPAAAAHYNDTVKQAVPLPDILGYLDPTQAAELTQIYPSAQCFVWGLTPGKNNVNLSKWGKIKEGDITLFSAGGKIFASAVVTYKLRNHALAAQLWGMSEENVTWEYRYFLDEVQTLAIPYSAFNSTVGYKDNFVIQGFSLLDSDKSQKFIEAFGLRSETYLEPVDETTYLNLQDKMDALTETDAVATTKRRMEQGFLKKHLFQRRTIAACGICTKEYPTAFLVAAHIKRRAACTPAERKDLNVVMPMCKFGCDDLFENGYIAVENGQVISLNKKPTTIGIQEKVAEVAHKECSYFTPERASYFHWHFQDHSK